MQAGHGTDLTDYSALLQARTGSLKRCGDYPGREVSEKERLTSDHNLSRVSSEGTSDLTLQGGGRSQKQTMCPVPSSEDKVLYKVSSLSE